LPLEGVEDYARFSRIIYDDDTVLPTDPRKLFTDFDSFLPYTHTHPGVKYLIKGPEFATPLNPEFKIGPLPFVVNFWRYMDYFDSTVPSIHDLVSGFWKPSIDE